MKQFFYVKNVDIYFPLFLFQNIYITEMYSLFMFIHDLFNRVKSVTGEQHGSKRNIFTDLAAKIASI